MYIPYRKYSTYIIGGCINFLLKVVLTVILTEYLKITYFVSYVITLCVVVVYSFCYNMYLTFKVTHDKIINFIKYVIVLLLFNFSDALSVRILTEYIGFYYVFSIVIVTAVLFILKFIVFDKFVFSRRYI